MSISPTPAIDPAALALHGDALVCDFTVPYADIGDPRLKRALLPRYAASGVDCVSLSVGGDTGQGSDTLKLIARERARLAAEPERYLLAANVADIRRAREEGRLAVVFNFQGTDPLDGSLELVEAYYALGVRHMGLAYNMRNRVGDGCFEPDNAGLSLFGRKLIAQMNRCGMLIDGSHAGVRTTLQAMELSSAPVIFSHANPAGLCPHPRNIGDEQIRACAATGGVVGILGISNMLGTDDDVSPERIATHVDYCVQLVGIEHVGLALDFVYDPAGTYQWALAHAGGELPKSGNYRSDMPLAEPESYPGITQALLARGYTAPQVRAVLGENWLRVCAAVWK